MNAQPMAPRAYSINEFSAAYRICRTSTYAQIRCGRLRTFKCGKRTLISIEAAEAWRRMCEAESAKVAAA